MRFSFRALGLSSIALLLAVAARADEGMWTFDNLPLKQMKAKYNFEPSQAWLDHVRLSALRMSGGSASFVSADGLVLTNHHMGHGAIQQVSDKDHDYVENGFVAKTRKDEIKVPGLTMFSLLEMENVTAQVDKAVTPEMNEQQAAAARKEALDRLVKEQTERTKLVCEPVSLYQGGQLWIYRYKKHEDVRLVMAPEYDVAAFGKDWDNFTWPRHDLDFALFRVYENGKPYKAPHHLTWAKQGAEYGDMTFTVGHPGRTLRLMTLAQMEADRDAFAPLRIKGLDRARKALQAFAAKGDTQAQQVSSQIMGTENAFKSTTGDLAGLQDRVAMARVAAAEKELREKVAADPTLKAQAGESWTKIEEALKVTTSLAKEMAAIGQLNRLAGGLKRAGDKPVPASLQITLQATLQGLREDLGSEHPLTKSLLQGKGEEDLIASLKNGLPEEFQKLAKDFTQRNQAAQAVISEHQVRIAKARFAVYGTSTYPDATGTLRLSYGSIETFPTEGTLAQPFTTFAGLYDRHYGWGGNKAKAENGSWVLPERWLKRRDKLNLFTPYNYVTTNDITGGNSGSPIVNRKGEVIGLAFDGNIESLPGRYYFDGRANRTLSVDTRAIVEVLTKVFDAPHLVKELTGK
jgi:hypothetical protein